MTQPALPRPEDSKICTNFQSLLQNTSLAVEAAAGRPDKQFE